MGRPRFSSLVLVGSTISAVACGRAAFDTPSPGPAEPDAHGVDASAADAVPRGPSVDAADASEAANGQVGVPCTGLPLPPDQHYVPPGFCATVVASGLGTLRQITFAPNGDLFGATKDGAILRFRDLDGDGFFQPSEILEWATTMGNTNNAHVDAAGGHVYAGHSFGVQRWPYSPTSNSGGPPEDVIVDMPLGGHFHHTVHVYDGYMYVHSGSAENATNDNSPAYDDKRSLIRRFALSTFKGTPFPWLSGEIVSAGIRNANGFTRSANGRIYAVDTGMDSMVYANEDVYEDNPGEQLLEIAMGKRYGYPFCFPAQRIVLADGSVVPAGTMLYNQLFGVHDNAWCAANASKPMSFFQAHTSPLDLTFFETQPKGALPERYRGGAFVALHGSWNRSVPTGYKVVWMPFDAAGNAPMPVSTATTTTFAYETVFGGGDTTGPKDGPWAWAASGTTYGEDPRPAGVAISPIDGSLYVASDKAGYLYRVNLKAN